MTEPAFISLLSIAGSDCSGGAGIQADIKTCCAFGVYAATAVTAVTTQTFSGVREITEISPTAVEQQLQAVFDSMTPRVIKTGCGCPGAGSHSRKITFGRYGNHSRRNGDPALPHR